MMNKLAKAITTALALGLSATASAGFYVSSGDIYDGNGNKFVMRGVNHAHTWFPDKLTQSLTDIASTGANTVRVVLSNGHKWSKTSANDVANIIQKAKDNKMVVVLEVHDTTGYSEDTGAASLASATNYWLEIKDKLIGQEDYVIINIGNEPFGNGFNASDWINDHKTAITQLRHAGLDHTFIIDAPNWGQDWQFVMRDNAQQVFNHDPDKNVVFSVHMYEVFNTYSKINNYMSSFSNNGLPLIIGEFAATHKDFDVDEGSIMSLAVNNQVGYLGWSWDGNDTSYGEIDVVNNWDAGSLTTWGEILLNSSNGITATSQLSTIYTAGSSNGGNNNDNNNGNSHPNCSSASADPDGDGWGWENNQSCIVVATTSTHAPNGFAYCSSSSADPDNDGWGWENSASCVVRGSSADY
ncbi:cellulase family glycosylhydrolase [Algibacillus agarilyticus]|uniref:cellulase family glycosylhydrolase n=1 Tax=Algibacillus agarilyticus TaxID=2234133 RepID=UPI001E448B57|nr:cellulase family glycosylhydrolase [Algibacillus agarilyticus]